MDPPSNRTLRTSGVPRASKLPVANSFGKSVGSGVSSAYALPKRGGSTQPLAGARSIQGAEGQDGLRRPNLEKGARSQQQSELPPAAFSNNGGLSQSTLHSTHRRPRPSLSDRTMETLSQIPPSPSPRRRKSSFFTAESPMMSPARPVSSLSHSRPSTSAGHYAIPPRLPSSRPSSPTKSRLDTNNGNKTPVKTPSQRHVSSYVPRSLPPPKPNLPGVYNSTPSKMKSSNLKANAQKQIGTPTKITSVLDQNRSKTLAKRPSRPRPSTKDVCSQSEAKSCRTGVQNGRDVSLQLMKLPSDVEKSPRNSEAPPKSISSPAERPTPPKSSAALRETIAKAKAARRAVSKTHDRNSIKPSTAMDNFPEIEVGSNNKALLRTRIASARIDGRLNIAAMGLRELPIEILKMYDMNDIDDGSWAESVDLIKLVAADNELESIDEKFFPYDGASSRTEHDYSGNIFGGLETLDLHGNSLRKLPSGMPALDRLTTLNVSKNRLDNDSLGIIGEIESLRELRVAENEIQGSINPVLYRLKKLQILDLSNNKITTITQELAQFSSLQTLLISGNRLATLPTEAIIDMSLRELDASRNSLRGCLFPQKITGLPTLITMDVSYNALTSISESQPLALPSLQTLNISENRITELPGISAWISLITLTADGNQIKAIPDAMTGLPVLKNVDLARNDIRQLDEQIGFMDSLCVLRVANNPLRERRFLNMNTEDLKRELRDRLDQLDSAEGSHGTDDIGHDGVGRRIAPAAKLWPVETGGIVDRSSTHLQGIETSDLEPLIESNDIKIFTLHHNALDLIPQAIGLMAHTLTALDMSQNKLAGDAYLPSSLSLPKLKTLNLSANAISSLSPLLENLSAPALTELYVTRNRLSTLPILRSMFPVLTSVFASDNSIIELSIDSVRGLHVLDVAGNEIDFLEPKIGLLNEEGLRTFLVGANRFRVPRRDVVDKGTSAILTWLRGRIPDDE